MPRYFFRHADHAWQDARHFHNGDLVGAPEGVIAAQTNDEVDRLVGHFRERMRRIKPNRNQERANFAFKVVLDPAPLHLGALAMRNYFDAMLLQRRHQLTVVQHVLLRNQDVGQFGQTPERLHRVKSFFVLAQIGRQVRFDPDFEEFIQIGRHDAQITQTFQQGNVLAMSPVQHPFVERQNAVVAVQQRHTGKGLRRFGRTMRRRHCVRYPSYFK